MKITVNAIPPSNNQYLGNSRNFNVYRREKEKWHWLIKAAIRDKPGKPMEKATVHITYFFSGPASAGPGQLQRQVYS